MSIDIEAAAKEIAESIDFGDLSETQVRRFLTTEEIHARTGEQRYALACERRLDEHAKEIGAILKRRWQEYKDAVLNEAFPLTTASPSVASAPGGCAGVPSPPSEEWAAMAAISEPPSELAGATKSRSQLKREAIQRGEEVDYRVKEAEFKWSYQMQLTDVANARVKELEAELAEWQDRFRAAEQRAKAAETRCAALAGALKRLLLQVTETPCGMLQIVTDMPALSAIKAARAALANE